MTYFSSFEVTDGYHLQTPLYLYRQHNSNTSKVNSMQQDKNNFKCIQLAIRRLGLADLIELKPDTSHSRRVIKTLKKQPKSFKIDLSYTANRMGLKSSQRYDIDRWLISNMISDESLSRQLNRTISNTRIVRVGSFGSVKVASAVSAKIEKEHGVNTELFSIPTKSGMSYFVDVTAPNNDRESLELMRTFLKENKWKSEVIPKSGFRDIIAVNKDTSSILENYYDSLKNDDKRDDVGKSKQKYIISNHWRLNNSRLIFTWRKQSIF